MIRALAAMVAVLAALSGLPVRAADPVDAPDSHLASALDFLKITNAKVSMAAMIDSLMPLVLGNVRAQNPTLSDAAVQQFQSAFREEMTASLDDLMTITARIYEEHFTEDELRRLTAFYDTDVGKKYISIVPSIIKESLPIGAAWGREAGARAAQRAAERLRANGVNP
ncbi:MAG TPA: DUF2059 domain-containing protein [Micropepsaceae bacterium]|nr:DUF2059 domain-containing protein [Micropepsaceae bacterium]